MGFAALHTRTGFVKAPTRRRLHRPPTLFAVISIGALLALLGCSEKQTAAPKKIEVVGDRSYAPYEFLEGGVSKGLLVDLWGKWSERTGVAVDYTLDNWGASQEKVKTGRADAVGGIMRDPEREKYYDFIRQIMSLDEYVYFRSKKFPNAEFTDFHQLVPYVVGIVEADEAERMYRRYVPDKVLNIKLYPSYNDLVKHAIEGEVDIFLMEQPVARYWLDVFDKGREFERSKGTLFSQMQYIAVRKGNEALANLINDGFDQLSNQDVMSVRDKWEGYKINITEDQFIVKLERLYSKYFYLVLILLYLISALVLWTFLLVYRPRAILIVNQALRRLEIPAIEIGPVKGLSSTTIRWLLLVAPFEFLPRVLDDWIRANERQISTSFQNILTVQSKKLFYAVDITVDGIVINDQNSRDREIKLKSLAARIFSESRAILVIGEGGIGKTSIACWFGQQALVANAKTERTLNGVDIFPHPILPILFESDIPETESVKAVSRTKLSDLVGFDVSEALLTALVTSNRVFVIVDGYSERDKATQSKFSSLEPSLRFRRMLITSRTREAAMGIPIAVIEPHRLSGPVIANFLSAYVDGSVVSDELFYRACAQISVLIRTANVTPLFVALYGQMLDQKTGSQVARDAPRNIPDLVEEYLATINDRVSFGRRQFPEILMAAKAASWACLQPNFVPGELSGDRMLRLTNQAGRPLQREIIDYLSAKLGFLLNTRGDIFKVSQDPLAEYLAAIFLLEAASRSDPAENPNDALSWNGFVKFVADRTDSVQSLPIGFISALLDVAKHKGYNLDPPILAQLQTWEEALVTEGRSV
ncbi:transporter substrate-binding domain-containing protein [Bradyrhizobium sp.]